MGITTFLIVNCQWLIVNFSAVGSVNGNWQGLGLQALFVKPLVQSLTQFGQFLPDLFLNLTRLFLICHLIVLSFFR